MSGRANWSGHASGQPPNVYQYCDHVRPRKGFQLFSKQSQPVATTMGLSDAFISARIGSMRPKRHHYGARNLLFQL